MKLFSLVCSTLLACLACASPAAENDAASTPPASAEAGDEHAWLQQLAGDWDVRSQATMEPGAAPVSGQSTERARMLGGLWLVAEGSTEFDGDTMSSRMTIGYDPEQQAFVGTWVDSVQTKLWIYRGFLDADRRVLTLETEGPSMGDPTTTARYRDVIEVLGPDSKRLTSSIETDDGWQVFMQAEYQRKG